MKMVFKKKINAKFIIIILLSNLMFSFIFSSDEIKKTSSPQVLEKEGFVKIKLKVYSFVSFIPHKKILLFSQKSLSGKAFTAYFAEKEFEDQESSGGFLSEESIDTKSIELYIHEENISKVSKWKNTFIFPFHNQQLKTNNRNIYEITI